MKRLIDRYRQYRNYRQLADSYNAQYAFIGIGNHALQNIYPVIDYLHLPLKYICCRSMKKLPLIEHKFNGVIATTSINQILDDDAVKGVFVVTSPDSHFHIAKQVLESGKFLFVEKPPCTTLQQFQELIKLDINKRSLVGLQKRYSPFTRILQRRLAKEHVISYRMTYCTGAYPEGNPILDLFIHPIDYVCHIFGDAKIEGLQKSVARNEITIHALLKHGNVIGLLELSTHHSWSNTIELLQINSTAGEYTLENMDKLTFSKYPKPILGIPAEKITHFCPTITTLGERSNFSPLISNNQLYTQGFYSEIKTFADIVEGRNATNLSNLHQLSSTYSSISDLSATSLSDILAE